MREIGTLLRELKRYGNAGRDCALAAEDALAIAAALEAAREDAADAARYRWLADNAESLPYPDMWRDKEWLDAAIDQARGKGNGNG